MCVVGGGHVTCSVTALEASTLFQNKQAFLQLVWNFYVMVPSTFHPFVESLWTMGTDVPERRGAQTSSSGWSEERWASQSLEPLPPSGRLNLRRLPRASRTRRPGLCGVCRCGTGPRSAATVGVWGPVD